MDLIRKLLLALAIGVFSFSLAACESNGDDVGDDAEEVAEDMEDSAEDAADDVEDAAEDAADDVEDAAE